MSEKKLLTSSYKDFEFISSNYIPDCSSTGIYLRHKKTGLEVFHLVNDDEENLFSFCFRTPVKNSKGGAHIIEHSVLCGSERFPLKEPFTNLMNQSMNTFLNAMTYPDKTIYPASSIVKEDYFNIMNVYGDAVFFPLLREESFSQEAHRFEIKEDGSYEIQGVVYNEMKGAYSDYDSVATDVMIHSVFKNTNYEYDSGGDPLCIPDFSYQDFKDFHKKYYSPANCLVFLYGNIPTEEQLDFIQENFLNKLEKNYSVPFNSSSDPVVNPEISKIEEPEEFSAPLKVKGIAPGQKSIGNTVSICWRCEDVADTFSNLECAFLNEILLGHDGSPLSKALVESELGDDVSPASGVISDMKKTVMNYGLHGVKDENIQKVFDLILSVLEDVAKNGVNRKDIDSTLMAINLSNREVLRVGGPFSLVYLDRVLGAWNYGKAPYEPLKQREIFAKISENVENDSEYIQKLVKKYLLDNKNCTFVSVSPSEEFQKNREIQEQNIIQKYKKLTDDEEVSKLLDNMHNYQSHVETEEEVSCIPFVNPSELSREIRYSNYEIKEVPSSASPLTFIKSVQNTNGISYFYVGFPLDAVQVEDLPFVKLFSHCFADCGFDGMSWSESADASAVISGGFGTRIVTLNENYSESAKKFIKSIEKYNLSNRNWFFVSFKTVTEKIQETFTLFAKLFTTVDFADKKRIKTILEEFKASLEASIVPSGNRYLLRRALRTVSKTDAIDEVLSGISQYYTVLDAQKNKIEKLQETLIRIKNSFLKAGCILFNTSDEESMKTVESCVENFVKEAQLKPLCKKNELSFESILNLTKIPGQETADSKDEIFTASTQVGYAVAGYPMNPLGTKENAAEIILAKYLSGTLLWEKIRTSGGAYGASARTIGNTDGFFCTTYRDPSPVRSISVFKDCFKEASELKLSQKDLDRLITGNYGDGHQPRSPYGEGWVACLRILASITDEDRKKYINLELDVTSEDVQKAAENLFKNASDSNNVITSVMVDKKEISEKNTGVIVNLPL